MNYYIWNKEDSVMGLSAQTLFASRPDFKYDAVIVIHKNDDKNNVVMMETMEGDALEEPRTPQILEKHMT